MRATPRQKNIPRRVLERRSMQMQAAYVALKQLTAKMLQQLEQLTRELTKSCAFEPDKPNNADKKFKTICYKNGLAAKNESKRIDYLIPKEAIVSILTSYQLY